MSNYLDKLAYVEVFINGQCSIAQMHIREDTLAYLGALYLDDIMSHITFYYYVFLPFRSQVQ